MEDYNIFKDKNLSDIVEDVYTTAVSKRLKINGFIEKLQGLVKDASDAQALVPIMKDLLDVSVKNDELVIKMLNALQKNKAPSTESNFGLTEEDKQELLKSVNEIKDESIEIDSKLTSIEERNV